MRTMLLLGALSVTGCVMSALEPAVEETCCNQVMENASARFSNAQGEQAIVELEYAHDVTSAALRWSANDVWRFAKSVSNSTAMRHECNQGINLVLEPATKQGRLEAGVDSIPFTIEPRTQASLGSLSGDWEYSTAATMAQVRIVDLASVLFLFDLRQPCAIMAGHIDGRNFELAAQSLFDHSQLVWAGEFSADFTSASGTATSTGWPEGATTASFVLRRMSQ